MSADAVLSNHADSTPPMYQEVEKPSTHQLEDANATSLSNRMPAIIRALSAEERDALNFRLRRKIDLRLLPMMLIMYILNYLDRNNIASARLAGLEKDLDLHGSQFQVCLIAWFSRTHI